MKERLIKNLGEDWYNFFEKYKIIDNHLWTILSLLAKEYKTYTCYPVTKNIFRAFRDTRLDSLKVIFLGQDPYHNKYKDVPSACGLCFATENGYINPSGRIILQELNRDLQKKYDTLSHLTSWSGEGVLMLNTALTVREGVPNSHKNLWKDFTEAVLVALSMHNPNLIYILSGKQAQSHMEYIPNGTFFALLHPMSDVYKSGDKKDRFVNSGIFSKVNRLLVKRNKQIIKW